MMRQAIAAPLLSTLPTHNTRCIQMRAVMQFDKTARSRAKRP
jgi:hypothetical protein